MSTPVNLGDSRGNHLSAPYFGLVLDISKGQRFDLQEIHLSQQTIDVDAQCVCGKFGIQAST
jgi:hypothetical protein